MRHQRPLLCDATWMVTVPAVAMKPLSRPAFLYSPGWWCRYAVAVGAEDVVETVRIEIVGLSQKLMTVFLMMIKMRKKPTVRLLTLLKL